MAFIVSEAVATAIFTICRLLYNSTLGVIALILFSRLPGGSSAKFWYEQPDMVSKLTSLFHPFGPTGRRGSASTNFIALLCTLAAVALNILPTILSKLSPITSLQTSTVVNSTLAPISSIFIPTLTDINLPGLSNAITSKNATNKFLCSYVTNGCLDARNVPIAKINWDEVVPTPIEFYHADTLEPSSLTVSINDSFTPPQYMSIAKAVFNTTTVFPTSVGQWSNNTLKGFYMRTIPQDFDGDSVLPKPYDLLHSDQFFPLQTPDIADLLRQGRNTSAPMPSHGSIDRAERWVAVHRTETLSSLVWQTANAHEGQVGSDWQTTCFLCSLLDLPQNASQITTIQNSLLSSTTGTTQAYAVHSSVDGKYRLSTALCLLQLNQATQGLSYFCLHSYSQIWSISHLLNPYMINGKYTDPKTAADLGDYGTAFPIYPPPTNLSDNRTYFPIVPIFQIRSRGNCSTTGDWNPQAQTLQAWMKSCATADLGQVNSTTLDAIGLNIWQLSSTITVGGFLINATYFGHDVGILIDIPVMIIVGASVVLCLLGNLILALITSPIHRRSLYEAVRIMVPDSKDPYNMQRVILDLAPTNTLRLEDSIYDKNVSYLKLDNRLLVAMAEDVQGVDDTSTINTENPTQDQIQDWSRKQLLKF